MWRMIFLQHKNADVGMSFEKCDRDGVSMRLADYVIKKLIEWQIEHIFMVNGRGVLYLTDAAAAERRMHTVCVHHEQAAAYAAVSYAASSRNMGACLLSTGCASTNAVTGVLCAWQDSVPCIFISGNHMLHETVRYTGLGIRTFGQQENDIISMVENITKYAVMISDPSRICYELEKAYYMANEGRKGPVWIDIPLDLQNARIEETQLEHFEIPKKAGCVNQQDISYVMREMEMSQRPVFLIGSGVKSAGADKILRQLAQAKNIPVTYSASAADTIGAGEEVSIGTVGAMGGSRAGNFAVQNADLVLAVGCRLTSMITSDQYSKFARDAKVIVIDIDPLEHEKKSVKIDRLITADAGEFLQNLMDAGVGKNYRKWMEKCLHWKEIFPVCEDVFRQSSCLDLYEIAEIITEYMPEDGVVITDAGLEELILPSSIRLKDGQRIVHPNAQGAMGFALPAAVGAAAALCRPICVFVGDGSFMFNMQELQTIRYHDLPISIFINNNNGYATICRRQRDLFRRRTIGNNAADGLGLPDFEKVAAAFEIPYERILDRDALAEAVQDRKNFEGPMIYEIGGNPDQKYIHSSYARNAERKIVHRPLEDQSPYLGRNIFLDEMIVEPIDQ